jgi:hypothetical protein
MAILTVAAYAGLIIFVDSSLSLESSGTMAVAFGSGRFYLNFVLIVGSCAVIDYLTYAFTTLFSGSVRGTLTTLVKERNTLNFKLDLPPQINKLLDVYDNYRQEDVKEDVNMILKDNRMANLTDLEMVDRVIIDKNLMSQNNSKNNLN